MRRCYSKKQARRAADEVAPSPNAPAYRAVEMSGLLDQPHTMADVVDVYRRPTPDARELLPALRQVCEGIYINQSIFEFRYPVNKSQRLAATWRDFPWQRNLKKPSTVLAFSQFSQPPNSKMVIPLEDGANLVTSKPPASISLQIVAAQN